MLDSLKSIADRIATPGDIAASVPAGIIGYSLDAGLDVVSFMEPGVVGALTMAGALAAKKAIEAGLAEARRVRRRKRLIAHVGDLRAIFLRDDRADLSNRLDRLRATHEVHGDEDRLARQLEDVIDEYERGRPVEPQPGAGLPSRTAR